jgi:hypothetical protein
VTRTCCPPAASAQAVTPASETFCAPPWRVSWFFHVNWPVLVQSGTLAE